MTSIDLHGRLTLTVPEAGRMLSLGRDAAYAAAERDQIPVQRIGRRLVVPTHALLRQLGMSDEFIARALGLPPESAEPGASTAPGPAVVHALAKKTGDLHDDTPPAA